MANTLVVTEAIAHIALNIIDIPWVIRARNDAAPCINVRVWVMISTKTYGIGKGY